MDRYTDFLRAGTGRQKVDGHERDLAPFDTEGFGSNRRRRDRGHHHPGGPDRPRAGHARILARVPLCRGSGDAPGGPVPHRREPHGERADHPAGGNLAADPTDRNLAAAVRRLGPRDRPRWRMERWARRTDPAVRRMASASGLCPDAPVGGSEEARPGRRYGRGVRHRRCLRRRRPRPLRVAHHHDQRVIQSRCGGARWQRVLGERVVAVRFGVGVGGELSPFGSGSGSTGNSSTGAGAPSDISAIAAKVAPDLVDINTNLSYEDEQAAGTGMVLTSTGLILTNNHVIDGATSISATDVGNGKTYSAKVVGYDRTGDVAVIKLVDAKGLRTISTSPGTAAVGQAVVGVGNAGGTGGTPSAAGGSITNMNQSITASDDGGGNSENLSGLIETNAGIQPGDSGGSLVNTSGQVIGMDTAASAGSAYQATATQGYAIPIGTALSIAKRIEAGDTSSTVHIGATGFLGVSIQASSAGSGGFGGSGFGDSGGTGSTSPGADVEGTLSGSPAAKAGLVQGDVITAVDGRQVSNPSDLSNLLQRYHPGDSVELQWTNSSGQTQTASVTLENGPPA